MSAGDIPQRLAAIMAADVAGYTRLMERDEAGTVAAWRVARADIIDPTIARHDGRIVKLTGDGFLAEFTTVERAVRCALALQGAFGERFADMPEDRRVAFRVGVNLGDIYVDRDDIYGTGVNVAARLEGLAEAGGICVSADVYRQVRGKLDAVFEDMGEHALKNIAEPVRVYRVRAADRAAAPAPAPAEAPAALPLPDKPSIAVLAFQNMSGDAEQEYFSDGISEDIITELSKVGGLFVIARNSSFAYRGKAASIRQIGRALGVGAVLEGSVRKAGNRVRVTAQLIDAATEGHLWAERYDRELADIFAVQDEVTRSIVGALRVRLVGSESVRLTHKETRSLEAYDCLLRGREAYMHYSKSGNETARALFEKAIALDPDYALAQTELGRTYLAEGAQGWSPNPLQTFRRGKQIVKHAISLDDAVGQAHEVLGFIALWLRQHELALAEGEESIRLNPSSADSHNYYGMSMIWSGRPEDGLELVERAIRLNPTPLFTYYFAQGLGRHSLRRYEDAIASFKRSLVGNPKFPLSLIYLSASYAHIGQIEEAQRIRSRALDAAPGASLEWARQVFAYKDAEQHEHLIEGLQLAGFS